MKKFASQFVSKSPLARLKGKQDSIKPMTKAMKEAAKLGGAGAIGIIGGAAGAGAKAGVRGVTISKPNPGGVKGTSAPRTGKGKTHDLIPGGRSMKGMKSGQKKPKSFGEKAFDAFGEATMQYQKKTKIFDK